MAQYWDHCIIYMMNTLKLDSELKSLVPYDEDSIQVIRFFYSTDTQTLPPKPQPTRLYGLFDPPTSDTDSISDMTEMPDSRPHILKFETLAEAFSYLTKDGWEAVSFSEAIDRYSDTGLQQHTKVLFKRPSNPS